MGLLQKIKEYLTLSRNTSKLQQQSYHGIAHRFRMLQPYNSQNWKDQTYILNLRWERCQRKKGLICYRTIKNTDYDLWQSDIDRNPHPQWFCNTSVPPFSDSAPTLNQAYMLRLSSFCCCKNIAGRNTVHHRMIIHSMWQIHKK